MTLYRGYRVESARKQNWDYALPAWYFVTICAKDHICYFGNVLSGKVALSRMGQIAQTELQNLVGHYSNLRVDEAVIMPNHVHAILVIEGRHAYSPTARVETPSGSSLAQIVGSYKSGVTRICHQEGFHTFAWQARYHDHILRTNSSVNAVRDYIQNNPANWQDDRDNPANLRRDAACRVSGGVTCPPRGR